MPKFNGVEYPETCDRCQFFCKPVKLDRGFVFPSSCHRHAPIHIDGWPHVEGTDVGCPEGVIPDSSGER